MKATAHQIYTIGHSDHPVDEFLAILIRHEIALIVDVRSQPYSRWAPQYNREILSRSVQDAGIRYLYMGDSLGGRPKDRAFYQPGEQVPDYGKLAQSPGYLEGIESLLSLAEDQRLAIMCSEGDYAHCHRFHLIAPTLLERGVQVLHIRPDATVAEDAERGKQLSLF